MDYAKYQLLDPLPPEQYEALERDIVERGVQVPVELDETGHILDGHHRAAICARHGLEYPTITRDFRAEDEKLRHVFALNVARRHLPPFEWGAAFGRLLDRLGVERGRGRNQGEHSATVAECAEAAGVSERTARHRLKMADDFEALPEDLQADVRSRALSFREAQRVAQKRNRFEAGRAALPEPVPDDDRIRLGDFRTLGESVPDASVHLVFVDPPYRRDDLSLYSELGRLAARVLVPGGSLAVLTGQMFLPEIFASLSEHLEYQWVFSVVHAGAHLKIERIPVRQQWKPLLWLSKGEPRVAVEWTDDLIESSCPERVHPHQQSEIEAAVMIEATTWPGEMVLDPTCGSGTTLVAAERLGRRSIGFDVDPEAVELARRRLAGCEIKDSVLSRI